MKPKRASRVAPTVLLLLLFAVPGMAAAADRPKCLGKPATIWGKSGWIGGTPGNDRIVASLSVDYIYGRGGNDVICGTFGNLDTRTGDRYFGGKGNDILIGGRANDDLLGGPGEDFMTGNEGKDTLKGGAGNDVLVGRKGNDKLDGGANTPAGDHAWFLGKDAVTADLNTGRADGAGRDRLIGIEGLIGSTRDDILIGNALDNTLNGSKGNDVLIGGLGSDRLIGGSNDPPTGDPSNPTGDWADFQAAADARGPLDMIVDLTDGVAIGWGIDDLDGIENVAGSKGRNELTGDADGNSLVGSDQGDRLVGLGGDDLLFGHGGGDALFGDQEPNPSAPGALPLPSGAPGEDALFGGPGGDSLWGGLGGDTLNGGEEDTAQDRALFDIFATSSGVSVDLRTTALQDTRQGLDSLIGIENLDGTSFADTLIGDDGANVLAAFGGNDSLYGYGGDDYIEGSTGSDSADGGSHVLGDTCKQVESPLNCEFS